MSRTWSVKALAIFVLVLLAAAALVPTLFTPSKKEMAEGVAKPEWVTAYGEVWDNRLNLGLDLQGGLLLQYRVEVEKAVSDKSDRVKDDIDKRIKRIDSNVAFTTQRDGLSAIEITITDPAKGNEIIRLEAFSSSFLSSSLRLTTDQLHT